MSEEKTLADLDVYDIEDMLVDENYDYDNSNGGTGALDHIGEWFYHGVPTKVKDLGTVRVVQYEGGEGKGDEALMVFEITDGKTTRWFRKEGGYASYDGFDWDGEFRETHPVTREVVFYD